MNSRHILVCLEKEVYMLNQNAQRLSERIKKAIQENSISVCTYEELMNLAYEDGVLDAQKSNLLRELHHLVENGSVRWVPCGIN